MTFTASLRAVSARDYRNNYLQIFPTEVLIAALQSNVTVITLRIQGNGNHVAMIDMAVVFNRLPMASGQQAANNFYNKLTAAQQNSSATVFGAFQTFANASVSNIGQQNATQGGLKGQKSSCCSDSS